MKKNSWKLLASLAVGLALIVLWIKLIDVSAIAGHLKEVRAEWVLAAMILYVLAYFLRSLRWRIILQPIEKISIKQAFVLFMAGMLVNYLIPVRAGELAKSFFLKGLKKTPVSLSLPTIFIDKMMDLFPILLVLLLLPLVPVRMSSFIVWALVVLIIIFLLFLGIIILAVKKQKKAADFLKLWFFWLPKKLRDKINNFLEIFVKGLGVAKQNKKKTGAILLLTILAVATDAAYIVVMFWGFGYHLPFLIALFGYTLINLSYILPTPPAQIGSNEVVYIAIFTLAFGIDKNLVATALGFAHLLTGSLIFIIGIISLQYLGIKLGSAFSLPGRDN